jgi:hypothetical protein
VDFTTGEDELDLSAFGFSTGAEVRALAEVLTGGILLDLPGNGSVFLRGIASASDLLDDDLIL